MNNSLRIIFGSVIGGTALALTAVAFSGSAQPTPIAHPVANIATSTFTAGDGYTASTLKAAKLSGVDSLRALQSLQQNINKLLENKTLQKTEIGLSVFSLNSRKELFARNSATPLTPASTTKLLPTFGALEQFGTEYKVATSICTDAVSGIGKDGTLRGNVYLVGHGDPLLSVTDIENLAVQLYNLGVKHITGSIYGDDSFFDHQTSRRDYSGDGEEVQPTGPISALTVQKNIVTVLVSGGPKVNQPVRVQTIPYSDTFTFSVQAVTKTIKPVRATKRRRWLKPTLTIREATATKNGGKQHFVVAGSLNPNTTVSQIFFVQNPPLAAADLLRKRLETVGVQVDGKFGIQKTPNTSVVLTEFLRPITEILSIVNKKSDNFCAEHLFKMLGNAASGDDREKNNAVFSPTAENRSAQASVQQLQTILKDHAIPVNSWTINDGSGLSRRNRIAPSVLVKLLDEADRAPFAETFFNLLSVAGLDGTLEHRMRGTLAEYNVHAKTGTHKNVSALAGYLKTKDGERLVFSFMFNGWGVWHYKGLENKLCELLTNFSYYAPPDSTMFQ